MARKIIFITFSIIVLLGVWLTLNPQNGFGFSVFGITTFNKIPYIYSDIEISVSGKVRIIEKTHLIEKENVNWLLEENPEILILSKGWDGSIIEIKNVNNTDSYRVIIKNNQEAKKLYKQFKREGKKVAIRYHSTC